MNYIVKDLMVPISEYITVSEGSSLFDAVLALEEAQLYFDGSKKYRHRAVLIMDKNNRVVGKLSQLNVLRALGVEDDEKQIDSIKQLSQFGFSPQFVSQMEAQTRYKDRTLKDICGFPATMNVENFMKKPTPGEHVDENEALENIIPQFLQGAHLSLLVTREEDIVGILRLSDVFAAVFHAMKECQL